MCTGVLPFMLYFARIGCWYCVAFHMVSTVFHVLQEYCPSCCIFHELYVGTVCAAFDHTVSTNLVGHIKEIRENETYLARARLSTVLLDYIVFHGSNTKQSLKYCAQLRMLFNPCPLFYCSIPVNWDDCKTVHS